MFASLKKYFVRNFGDEILIRRGGCDNLKFAKLIILSKISFDS